MNKAELMEYLRAICDGENALYACNEAISTINKEIYTLTSNSPREPVKPADWIETNYNYSRKKMTGDGFMGGGGIGAVLGGIVGVMISVSASSVAALFAFVPLGAIIGGVMGAVIGTIGEAGSVSYENTERRNSAYEEHERQMDRYKKGFAIYKKECEIREASIQKLKGMIEENNKVADRIKRQLEKLYGKDIVHSTFRNMIAVNQILEYLEMGVCEELTGPNGAYAQYLLDVRTDKICSSIDSLKQMIRNMAGQIMMLQGQMISEIRNTNENMTRLGGELRAELAGINQQIIAARENQEKTNEILAEGNRYIEAANSKIDQMSNILSHSAHNQYIALRESGMNNYMLRNPDLFR